MEALTDLNNDWPIGWMEQASSVIGQIKILIINFS